MEKWKTITIGGKKEYKFNEDIYLSEYAKDLQSRTPLAKKKEKIDLVVLTPKDLGFTEYPTTTELFDEKNLAKYGVGLCPAEVGLALREEYNDQPNGEWLYIAMTPISASDGSPGVWLVGRSSDGRRWLDGIWARDDLRWFLSNRVVFRLRKISLNSETSSSALSSEPVSSALSAELSSEASLESAIEKVKKAGYIIYKQI